MFSSTISPIFRTRIDAAAEGAARLRVP